MMNKGAFSFELYKVLRNINLVPAMVEYIIGQSARKEKGGGRV